ncbi:hypothetical protein EIP86_011162 [Pleurotus ostreatoroseus]|nr:hypothetical protein EIP86_011162 [Pleurotus ostreatoroseus]
MLYFASIQRRTSGGVTNAMRSYLYAGSYRTTRTKKSKACSAKPSEIYTDASVSREGDAGTAVVALESHNGEPRVLSRKYFPPRCHLTPHDAECCGAIIAVDSASHRTSKGVPVIVYTDDLRAAQVGSGEAKPKGPWEKAQSRVVEVFRKNHPQGLLFKWIPSHSGIAGNTHADKEAGKVRKEPGVATTEPLPPEIEKLTQENKSQES